MSKHRRMIHGRAWDRIRLRPAASAFAKTGAKVSLPAGRDEAGKALVKETALFVREASSSTRRRPAQEDDVRAPSSDKNRPRGLARLDGRP